MPKTIFLTKDVDFSTTLSALNWSCYFIKDHVKSLTTTRGSVAKNIGEVYEVISLIEKFRGKVEGGVCGHEFEVLQPETEKRYFVFNKIAFARNGVVPTIVNEIAKKIDCPFFSVDMVLSIDDAPRLVELGDGQVSDRKKWAVDRFFDVFKHHA